MKGRRNKMNTRKLLLMGALGLSLTALDSCNKVKSYDNIETVQSMFDDLPKKMEVKYQECRDDVQNYLKITNDRNASEQQLLEVMDSVQSKWGEAMGIDFCEITAPVGLSIVNRPNITKKTEDRLLRSYNPKVFLAAVKKFKLSNKVRFREAVRQYALIEILFHNQPENKLIGQTLVEKAKKLGYPNSDVILTIPNLPPRDIQVDSIFKSLGVNDKPQAHNAHTPDINKGL